MRSRPLGFLGVGALLAATGCASGPRPLPTIAAGAEAEVSIDGLHLIDNSVMLLGYAKPDLDLSPYTAFILDPVTVAYQKDPGGRTRLSIEDNFALTPTQMERLKGIFQQEVVEALTENDGYELVTEPAPNALRITARLIDLVVRVPTELGGRQEIYTASYGEVTLILELHDSQSGEILARAGDRQDPTNRARDLAEVNPVFMRADVTRMFRHWADIMRERLDQIRELGI